MLWAEFDFENERRKAKRQRRRLNRDKRHEKICRTIPDVMHITRRSTYASWWYDERFYRMIERFYGVDAANSRRKRDATLTRRLTERGRLTRFIYREPEYREELEHARRDVRKLEVKEQMDLLDAYREGGYCGRFNECHSYYCKPCNEPWWLDDDDYEPWLDYPEYWEGSENEFPPSDFGLGYDAGLSGDDNLPPENVNKEEWVNGWSEGHFDRNYK